MSVRRNRILVVGLKGNRQGTEMAVDNFVRAVQGKVSFDYLYHEEPAFDGCRLPSNRSFSIPRKSKSPLGYWHSLKKLFSEHADEWSAVWLNTGNLTNIDSLAMAERHGVPRRIVHAHSDTWLGGARQRIVSEAHRRRMLSLATDCWACSEGAGRLFFGNRRFTVVPDAIPLERYAYSEETRKAVRARYGLGNKFVIGSVGALIPRKNHAFLIRLLPEVVSRIPSAMVMVVGEGAERGQLESLASELGVTDRVILAGSQDDVSGYLSAFDCFAFPSAHEGLGLALVEAQANGLPVVASDACTRDVVISDGIQFAGLDEPDEWVDLITSASRRSVHLDTLRSEKYNLAHNGDYLYRLFCPLDKRDTCE